MMRSYQDIFKSIAIIVCILVIVSDALKCRYGGKVRHYGRIISIAQHNQTCHPTTHFCLKLAFDFMAFDGRYKGILQLCDGEMTGFKEKFCKFEGCTTKYEPNGGKARVCCCSTDFCVPSEASHPTIQMVLLIATILIAVLS